MKFIDEEENILYWNYSRKSDDEIFLSHMVNSKGENGKVNKKSLANIQEFE